jgi:outer membrane scaffolding protein for murein synthesis (MipA/OmpV family)
VRAGVFAQFTWASSRYLQAFYGGSGSGPLNAGVGALASYELGPSWLLLGSVELRRLLGDAASSALTETRDSYYASASVAYRF